jgi:hypothetical protein
MTQDEIIEMAMKVGGTVMAVYSPDLEAFAKLVAAKERERIFSELLEMHLKAQRIHNHYLHAVMHIKAKDEARGEA